MQQRDYTISSFLHSCFYSQSVKIIAYQKFGEGVVTSVPPHQAQNAYSQQQVLCDIPIPLQIVN